MANSGNGSPKGGRLFPTFFLGGFECATGYNKHGQPVDQIAATQHDQFAAEDYRRLRDVGIGACREGVRWNLIDRRGRYDFSAVEPFVKAAQNEEMVVIWDLFHFGYPDDVDPFSPDFVKRFEQWCHAAAEYLGPRSLGTPYFTPVNEISYFSWAAGDAGLFAPHRTGKSWDLKVRLCEAALRGIEAIRDACPNARIVNVDPICRVVAPRDKPELDDEAARFNQEVVFQSLDIIAGKLLPELGGSRRHLDIVGVNYYWTNQWELTRNCIPLPGSDERHTSLADVLQSVFERYGGEVMITETSHAGPNRAAWVDQLVRETQQLRAAGYDLQGICLYPVLGMPEWHDPNQWARMGLWDLIPQSPTLGRIPHEPMLEALRRAQRVLEA